MQGADALVRFAREQMEKALQLHNYATVTKDNAEHRRFHAHRAAVRLAHATGTAPPPDYCGSGGAGAGGSPASVTPPTLQHATMAPQGAHPYAHSAQQYI